MARERRLARRRAARHHHVEPQSHQPREGAGQVGGRHRAHLGHRLAPPRRERHRLAEEVGRREARLLSRPEEPDRDRSSALDGGGHDDLRAQGPPGVLDLARDERRLRRELGARVARNRDRELERLRGRHAQIGDGAHGGVARALHPHPPVGVDRDLGGGRIAEPALERPQVDPEVGGRRQVRHVAHGRPLRIRGLRAPCRRPCRARGPAPGSARA